MAVDREVSRRIVEAELALAEPLARAQGWDVHENLEQLRFSVRMRSRVDGEEYILEFLCDDYKEKPPYVEFVDPVTGERGVRSAYPRNGNGFFHGLPCICAQFSRKAYQEVGGPHSDWPMLNWANLRPEFSCLGDMVLLVQRLIDNPQAYHGRMAPLKAREAS